MGLTIPPLQLATLAVRGLATLAVRGWKDYLPVKIANSQGLCEVGGSSTFMVIFWEMYGISASYPLSLGFLTIKNDQKWGVHLVNLHTWKTI